MRGPAAVEAKVVGRVDQSRAEVIVPDSIDDNSREERVVSVGDPGSELSSTIRFGSVRRKREVRVHTTDRGHRSRRDHLTHVVRIASQQDVCLCSAAGRQRVQFSIGFGVDLIVSSQCGGAVGDEPLAFFAFVLGQPLDDLFFRNVLRCVPR